MKLESLGFKKGMLILVDLDSNLEVKTVRKPNGKLVGPIKESQD